MITLFVIVVIATLVLAVTRAEGMRPLGLALVGMISLVLGARATAVFTETSLAPLVSSMVFAQDSTDAVSPAAATDEPTATPPEPVTTETPKSEAPRADEANADAAPFESETTDDAADVEATAADVEAIPAQSPEASDEAGAAIADSPELANPITVEAVTNVTYQDRDENSPNWLETKPWSEDGVYFVPVVSRLQISEPDRDRALDDEIKAATDEYVEQFLKNKHASTLLKLRAGSTVPNVTESFEEQVVVTAGTMYQSHALLAFDDNFRDAVSAKWDEVRATSRLMQTGLGAGIVILLLSTMFSYFKLDTATRGYYTGRLQFAAAAAILAVIAASVLFANYVPWM